MILTEAQISALSALLDLSGQEDEPVTLERLALAVEGVDVGDIQEWLWASRPDYAFSLQHQALLFGELEPHPLPEAVTRELYQDVRSDGPLPETVVSGRSSRLPPLGPVVYDSQTVAKILKGLVVFRIEGDEGRCYYFSGNRNRVLQTLRIYLMRAGRTSDEATAEAGRLADEAITSIGARVTPLQSEAQIIPEGFVRTDFLSVEDPFTGEALNLARVVSRMTRRYSPENHQRFIRTIVMRGGRKIHYVDWPYLRENYPLDLFQLPDLEGLKEGIGNRDRLIPFLSRLRHFRQLSPLDWSQKPKLVLVGFGGGPEEEGIPGLTALTEEEFLKTKQNLDKHYFRLVFDWFGENLFISELDGLNSLDLGQYFIGKPDRSPLEKALLARRWGTLLHDGGETRISWDDVMAQLEQQGRDPVEALWNLLCLADPRLNPNPEELVLVASRSGTVFPYLAYGVNLVDSSIEEVIGRDSYTRLFFARHPDDGRRFIRAIRGAYSLEPALAYVRGRLKRDLLHPAETGLLMTLWGTKPNSGGHTLSLQELARFLGENRQRLEDLGRFQRALGYPWPRKARQFVLTGFPKNGTDGDLQINLLKLSTELPPHQEGHFYLGFKKVKGQIYLKEAGGSYGLPLAFAILQGEGWANRSITHPLEKAVLASSWGRAPSARQDPALRLTWEELKNYVWDTTRNPIAQLWDLRRLTNPLLPDRPERIFLLGARKGKKETSPVISIQLLTGEEEKEFRTTQRLFRLAFKLDSDGVYRPIYLPARSHSASRALYSGVQRGAQSVSSSPQTGRSSPDSSGNDGSPQNFSGLSVFSGADDRQLHADQIMEEAQSQVFEEEGGAAVDLAEESEADSAEENKKGNAVRPGFYHQPWMVAGRFTRRPALRVIRGGLI